MSIFLSIGKRGKRELNTVSSSPEKGRKGIHKHRRSWRDEIGGAAPIEKEARWSIEEREEIRY